MNWVLGFCQYHRVHDPFVRVSDVRFEAYITITRKFTQSLFEKNSQSDFNCIKKPYSKLFSLTPLAPLNSAHNFIFIKNLFPNTK